MANNPETEALHQRAASHYLQGNFKAALDEWRQLLTLDSTDHRALEGARLCEMLTEEGESISIGVETTSATPVAPAPYVDDLDDLDELMAFPAGAGEGAPVQPTDGAIAWDLGAATGGIPPDPAMPAGEVDLGNPGATPQLDMVADFDALAAPAEATAVTELQNRVTQLLIEAQEAYDAGDRDLAMGVISRTFILDENNPDAMALKQRILDDNQIGAAAAEPVAFDDLLGEVPEPMTIEPTAVPDAPDPGEPLKLPTQPEGGAVAAPDLELMVEPTPELADSPEFPAGDSMEDSFDDPLGELDAEAEAPPVAATPRFSSKFYWLVVAGVALVILGAGGFTAWKFFGSSQGPKVAVVDPAAGDPAHVDVASAGDPAVEPAADPAANAEPAPAPEASTAPTPADVPSLLSRARQAGADGDHAQAVLAYGAVLEVEPANAEALTGLEEAGNRYRKKLVVLEKHEEGIATFNDGNYRRALSVFYRLPDAENNPTVDRYKANGWHNLGVQALKAGDCTRALESFKEMRDARPADKTAEQRIELAKTCRSADRDVAYARAVLALELRALDD